MLLYSYYLPGIIFSSLVAVDSQQWVTESCTGTSTKVLCSACYPMPAVGVLCQSRSAWNSDPPNNLHSANNLFTVWTAFSTLPFDCGYVGEEILCTNIQIFANTLNSADANCGLLSITSVSGMPDWANIAFSSLT